jgi:hypothetical protein
MAGPLRSTEVTPLRRYYGPGRHLLVFGRLPGLAGYTAYLVPTISRRDEEGFSSCSACPCHRAAASHPAEMSGRISQISSIHAAFAIWRMARLSGIQSFEAISRSLLLRPGDSWIFPRKTLSIGFRVSVSITSAIQTTGTDFSPGRLFTLLNMPAFAGHTSKTLWLTVRRRGSFGDARLAFASPGTGIAPSGNFVRHADRGPIIGSH